MDGFLPTLVSIEADHGTAVLTALRGNEHHTVGRLRTIDGGRGSVLQHVDALDVGRIERSDVATDAVYNIKRRRGTGGADTTDVDLESLTGLSRLRGDELFLLHAIADDHDIVERVGLFGKLNGKVVACHLHFLLHKTNVGYEKCLTVIGLQGEMSVEIRHSTCLRADDLDRRSRERLAISG